MSDTLNVTMENGTATETQEKTFTQDEVNAIVGERLKREAAKFSDYASLKEKADKFDAFEEAQKSELHKATERADELQKKIDEMTTANEIRSVREKVSKEIGVPYELLSGST